jgi:pimeloyl-ACP methyl ester carboxylesterase
MKVWIVVVASLAVLLAGCASTYDVNGEQSNLECSGEGDKTVVLLAGQGDSTEVWQDLRSDLGSDVRTCAWDYPGVGGSTGAEPMTASIAATSLRATLVAADVQFPVVLVGHSVAGLTVREFIGEFPDDVAGVVLFDPTVPSFARRLDLESFRPGWDGAASAREVEEFGSWPNIPVQILRHDSAVYLDQGIWDEEVEAAWVEGQQEYAELSTHGSVTAVSGSGHYVYLDQPDIAADAVRDVLSAAMD